MKFTVTAIAFSAPLFSGIASAVPGSPPPGIIKSRAITESDVTDFSANCRADNTGCTVSFKLVEVGLSPAVLTCTGSTASGTTFPTSMGINACSDPAVVFTFAKALSNFRLALTDIHVVGSSVGGSKVLPGGDFPTVTDSTGTHQTYTGVASFVIVPAS
ncbi:hypothetical protein QBC46DRAFT_451388 [Diplogelasinospora grovesii]|uniref:Hypersensitive response-inducing protein n=1 Tax=Diplogelasinospora grovesii TaxID=303347 RepID=A0AAN6N360_9PEZI|nr:hypothetical protein QBC46DRAFT_451388 [Diplogelasinospora grovesii]